MPVLFAATVSWVQAIVGLGALIFVALGIEYDLSDSRPVAKIDKHHHPMVPAALHPPLQDDGLPHMCLVQFSASMSSYFHITLSFLSMTRPHAGGGFCVSVLPSLRVSPAALQ